MGVSGLLPLIKGAQVPTTLETFRGKTLAIDSYAWLHKAVFSCAMELARDEPTQKYLSYMVKKLDMLAHFGIQPYFVFDGDYLPTKAGTEAERSARRAEYREQAEAAVARGDKRAAFGAFQKACDVTPEMARSVIDLLQERGISYVVAPYEADSQMVFLERQGIVQGIISEDSDLLVFGCQTLITKLNDRAECIEVRRENFKLCKVAINTFSPDQLRMMAILSGCDYSKGIPGIGITKAVQLVAKYSTIERVMLAIKREGRYKVPENYMDEYRRAQLAFQYQIVYNVELGRAQHFNDLPGTGLAETDEELTRCTGLKLSDDIHRGVAEAKLHPMTKQALQSREKRLCPQLSGTPRPPPVAVPAARAATVGVPSARKNFRTFSTPTPTTRGIDSFFSRTVTTTVQTVRKLSPQKPQLKLSPVSKRKRLLFEEQTAATLPSPYFTPVTLRKTEPAHVQEAGTPSKHTFSDDNITDPDDDADQTPITQKTHVIISPKSDDISEVEESPVRTKKAGHAALAGLKDRFALKAIPVNQPVNQPENLAREASRSGSLTTQTKKLSLQSYAYHS